jgi:hypothetical protein
LGGFDGVFGFGRIGGGGEIAKAGDVGAIGGGAVGAVSSVGSVGAVAVASVDSIGSVGSVVSVEAEALGEIGEIVGERCGAEELARAVFRGGVCERVRVRVCRGTRGVGVGVRGRGGLAVIRNLAVDLITTMSESESARHLGLRARVVVELLRGRRVGRRIRRFLLVHRRQRDHRLHSRRERRLHRKLRLLRRQWDRRRVLRQRHRLALDRHGRGRASVRYGLHLRRRIVRAVGERDVAARNDLARRARLPMRSRDHATLSANFSGEQRAHPLLERRAEHLFCAGRRFAKRVLDDRQLRDPRLRLGHDHLRDQVADLVLHLQAERVERTEPRLADGLFRLFVGRAPIRRTLRDRFVGEDAERISIHARRRLFLLQDLRRRIREARGRDRQRKPRAPAADAEHLHFALISDQHAARRDAAVDHPRRRAREPRRGVRGSEHRRDLGGDETHQVLIERFARELRALQQLRERLSVGELARDVHVGSVAFDCEHARRGGVREAERGGRFGEQQTQEAEIARELGADQLDGEVGLFELMLTGARSGRRTAREKDIAESAGRDPRQEDEMAELSHARAGTYAVASTVSTINGDVPRSSR